MPKELGVTQANVDEMLKSTNNPEVNGCSASKEFGEQFGLTNDWSCASSRPSEIMARATSDTLAEDASRPSPAPK